MKPNYLTILITTLCIFFNACHNSNTAPQLQLADSLIDKRADSALCILEKLSIEEISNKSAKTVLVESKAAIKQAVNLYFLIKNLLSVLIGLSANNICRLIIKCKIISVLHLSFFSETIRII